MSEVSLSLVLLVGAALLIVSLVRVQQVDPGFDPDRLFTATVTLPTVRYGDAERISRFVHDAVDQLEAIPGVRAAAATTSLPLGGNEWSRYFTIEGRPAPGSMAQVPSVYYRQVTPGYFRTMGATVHRGRSFSEQDRAGAPGVAIVNDTLARRFWPDEDPIGQQVSVYQPESLAAPGTFPLADGSTRFPRLTVVGIVADLRQNGLENEVNAEVFIPLAQHRGDYLDTSFLVARTSADPMLMTEAIQAAIARIDPNLPVVGARTMDSRLADSMAWRRFVMLLLGGFAAIALALAVVGLYGLMSYAVTQRRRELGVRAALGASASGLLTLVIGEGLRLTTIGAIVGLVLAAALSRLMTAQLFEVDAVDPILYAAVTVLFVLVAVVACGLPALRAARVDPVTALRGN